MKCTTPQPTPIPEIECCATAATQKPPTDQKELPKYLNEIPEKDVEKLKQHIRVLKNLSSKEEPRKKLVPFTDPPVIPPRSNTAALLRTKLQDRWIEVNLKSLMKKYSFKECDMDNKQYYALRKEALTRPYYEFFEEKERESFENLKKISQFAKLHDEPEFKLNRNFDFRLKTSKGIPIITETFTKHYDDYEKAPFINPKTCTAPKYCPKPPINEKEELFLYPVDEEEAIPLHRIKRLELQDGRTSKERARPPLKAAPKRTPLTDRRSVKKLSTKKPPWHYALQCKEFNMLA